MALRFLGQGPRDIALITGLSSDEKPVNGQVCGLFLETDTNKFYRWLDEWIEIPVGGSGSWGNITGTLSDQTDLQSALNGKSNAGHNHDSTYSQTDHHHDSDYAPLAHDHPAAHISDSSAVGRSVLTAADQAAARDAIAAAAADHTHPGGGSALDAWPVGSVYIAVDSTSPATRFGGGTWAAFGAGKVLVSLDSGDAAFDTAEETGGAKTVAAAGSVSQPTFTGSALGTHSHAAGTLAPSAHTGAAVADHASHTHTYTEVPNHVHTVTSQTATTGSATSYEHGTLDTSSAEAEATEVTGNPVGGVATGTTNGPGAALTHSVTQPAAHTMSGSSEAVSGGTPAGTVSQPTFTGSPTSVVQPYIVVYMWKRTA